jgi:hypothetical protein
MKLSARKTRLTFITNQTARYRGKGREIVIEVFPERRKAERKVQT